MPDDKPTKTNIRAVVSLAPLWFIGWLFTLGFIHPALGKAILGLLIWPYYLGDAVH